MNNFANLLSNAVSKREENGELRKERKKCIMFLYKETTVGIWSV